MSREADILTSMLDGEPYEKTPQSRNEAILRSIIDNTPYEITPQSEIERLLLEVKNMPRGGGSTFGIMNISEVVGSHSTITTNFSVNGGSID